MPNWIYGMERELQRFEQEEFGTNDWGEIVDRVTADEWRKAQERMTGMEEEQADWESDDFRD